MPSSRKLAEYLGISRLTVTLVYQELVARGYLDALPASGFVVSERAPQRRIDLPQRLVPARDVNWVTGCRVAHNRRQIPQAAGLAQLRFSFWSTARSILLTTAPGATARAVRWVRATLPGWRTTS